MNQMKKIKIFLVISMLAFSCSKNLDNTAPNEKTGSLQTESKSTKITGTEKLKLATYDTIKLQKYLINTQVTDKEEDSIALLKTATTRKSACQSLNLYNSEYSDYSNKIHLNFFYATTTNPANHPSISVSVPSGYAMVGGGAWVHDYSGNGAWLVKSYPMDDGISWKAESKDHIIQDPHCLTVFAIGMRIDGVDPAYLRSMIIIRKATSTNISNFPEATVVLPDNYILVGGGATDNYNGYGNMLTASYPTSTSSWHAEGKAYRRSDPSTITAYAIGIANISYPTVGYLGVTIRQNTIDVPSGPEIESVYAPVWEGYALTCPGGYCTYNGYGRMLLGVFPMDTPADANTISKDSDVYPDYGTDSALAIGIEKRPY
jgi:hypothetical protein